MRSLHFLLVTIFISVGIEAELKARNKPFKTIKRRLIGNLEDRFKRIHKNTEEVEEEISAASVDTSTSIKFSELFGFNIAEKVEMDFGMMEQGLLTLQLNERTSDLVQELVDANPCADTLVELNAILGAGAELIIDNAPVIERLLVSLNSLR